MPSIHKKEFFLIFLITLSLSACNLAYFEIEATPTATLVDPTPATVETATPGAQHLRELTICLGHEPNTLYINDNPNPAALSVLEAIYDGPLDSRDYGYQPVILQKTPSLTDGDASIIATPVEEGDWIIDVNGERIELAEGARVYPAGCQDTSCIVTYKDDMDLEMEQMVVNFSFLPNIRWADGASLTADDSVYAFDLATASKNAVSKFLLTRTEAYETSDELTTVWTGLPGYRDNDYMTNFWMPLPYHAWSEFSATELVESDVASRFPLGWGAFVVDEWIPAESITLRKNPLYYRADEGLPKIDMLTFIFISDPNTAIAALVDKECDILDPSIPLDGQVALLQRFEASGQLELYATEEMSVESIHFGVKPASHDDGTVSSKDRLPILSNPKTRQAIAYCLSRQKVVDTVLHGLTTVPDSYIPNEHPLYTEDLQLYSFNPIEGSDLLNSIGWKDIDNDPTTPRIAHNVPNVQAGTPLVLDYITTTSIQRREASEILASSLEECGVGVNLQYLPPEEFYKPAPEGPLFGRDFDLAQFAMGTESITPRCDWFTTASIPTVANDWVGDNLSAYNNTAYDSACEKAVLTLPNTTTFQENYHQTLAIYAEELPAIPLYPYLNVAATRPDLVGFSLIPNPKSALWNIENYDFSYYAIEETETPTP